MVKLTESQKDAFSFCKACTFVSFLVIGLVAFVATQVGQSAPAAEAEVKPAADTVDN